MSNQLLRTILTIPAILVGFTFHEYAHAKVADILGDKTPRFQGRLTLNPITHIDPIGFLMILICRFGWAKPVQINRSAFKDPYKDDLKVSLAGPIANLIVAILGAILYKVYIEIFSSIELSSQVSLVLGLISIIIKMIYIMNVYLFIFNLLPVPGLDGFAIIEDLFPNFFLQIEEKVDRYKFIIFIAIIYFGGSIISYPGEVIISLIERLLGII
ncbi:Zn-dependent protease (includes SpoIVFB) [Clostridium cavendishii DSM 21758]|uniref:Zn-dependent protease (Includes SpoIVFB) n=1 Tax=Clostridium cavendishii DSM 21758 TaxID=1121302 RepID=A0A1M6F5I2_9CLOT|nr:site-2 protease family protein [Clostridium cavendishii]SHI92922.1 Zn-dependent protease (includes SpoIVFB) [Clostridium cavendishii DSM 21758]